MIKYYDTDLIGSGGGYTMTEIEKKAEAYAEENHSYHNLSDHNKSELKEAHLAGAAAVIELIRERMPEPRHVELTEGMPLGLSAPANAGYNAYRSEILKLLDSLK